MYTFRKSIQNLFYGTLLVLMTIVLSRTYQDCQRNILINLWQISNKRIENLLRELARPRYPQPPTAMLDGSPINFMLNGDVFR